MYGTQCAFKMLIFYFWTEIWIFYSWTGIVFFFSVGMGFGLSLQLDWDLDFFYNWIEILYFFTVGLGFDFLQLDWTGFFYSWTEM